MAFPTSRPMLLVLCGLSFSKVSRLPSVTGAVATGPSFVFASHPLLRKDPKHGVHQAVRTSSPFSLFTFFRRAVPLACRASAWCRDRLSWRSLSSKDTEGAALGSLKLFKDGATAGVTKHRYQDRRSCLKASNSVVNQQQSDSNVAFSVEAMNGIFAVYKPRNWTSFDVVGKIRSTLGKKLREDNPHLTFKQCRIKVGHGGTLDPDATGVLVVGIGRGTKSMDLYTKGSKCYEAIGVFGHETDTADAQGVQVGAALPYDHVDQASLESALATLEGDIMQVPPVYSAIKIDGKRAYDLARKGIEVEMVARPAKVYSFRLTKPYAETAPEFHVRIECGGGTYVRSLIRDVARAVGTAAHMRALVRTKQGRFEVPDCLPEEAFGDAAAILAAVSRCAPLAEA